ncbi:hypothetical protein SASPL_132688 [Salvia splendens]|uniref:RING-CH-type domain-containing protein n=1 Tax=Salvia splendens TaxID=180675 RepID=A0A8X8X415_SALSN|nr:E3 ubiquitin-protein ligase MARCHF8-like [Salvia splendens]KAG6405106.1 hypothetical protein SASPL_132688 [Salvia splendens]
MDQELREKSEDCDSSRNLESVIAMGGRDLEEGGNKTLVVDVERGEACSSGSMMEAVAGNERLCRVCHLSAKEIGKSGAELIELGCGCKGELGFAHLQCAEAWFRVKGNRLCEICGEAAINISGTGDSSFVEEWNERRWSDGSNSSASDGSRRCLQGQPLCNFLMACLVIAFILPWFFRVNLF